MVTFSSQSTHFISRLPRSKTSPLHPGKKTVFVICGICASRSRPRQAHLEMYNVHIHFWAILTFQVTGRHVMLRSAGPINLCWRPPPPPLSTGRRDAEPPAQICCLRGRPASGFSSNITSSWGLEASRDGRNKRWSDKYGLTFTHFKLHLCILRVLYQSGCALRKPGNENIGYVCGFFWILNVFTHLVSRWWKCQPAWRHISERKTTSCIQEEKNGRTGVRGSPSEPDLQNAESTRHIYHSRFGFGDLLSSRSMTVEQMRVSGV